MDGLEFHKSSFSAGGNECVEVAITDDGGRAVRDSKNPDGGMLVFDNAAWSAFIGAARGGQFV